MTDPLSEMAQLIFDVLSGLGHDIVMYDQEGNQVFSPEKATRIWSNTEKLMITLSYTKGKNSKPLVTFNLSDVTNLEKFNNIKNAIKKHNLYDFSFDTEPYGRTLEPKNFKHTNVTESQSWSGTTRTSYFPVDQVNVVIRHSKPWAQDQVDSAQRWRRIKQIMLFTPDGQRLKFPYNHVLGARAMAQHVNQQNSMHDDGGELIKTLVQMLMDLRQVQSRCKSAQHWGVVEQVSNTRNQIKHMLKHIGHSHHYHTGITNAKKMIDEWMQDVGTLQEAVKPKKTMFKEARELDDWFDKFEPKNIFEDLDDREQVKIALDQAGGDPHKALDYLKRDVPGWESRFEEDPSAVTKELENIIDQIKKEEE